MLINKNDIIYASDKDFVLAIEQHRLHIKRIEKAVRWFNKNCVKCDEGKIIGSTVLFEKEYGICTAHSFRGYPFFECWFEFMPLSSNFDIGTGIGSFRLVSF